MPAATDGAGPRGLLLTGGGGAGKTTLSQAIGRELTERGRPTAVVDLDALSQFGPSPRPGTHAALRRRNLAAVWSNYRDAGARYVVVAGWLESVGERDAYIDSLAGCDVQVVRVVTPLELVEQRTEGTVRGHGWNLPAALASHARVAELGLEDFTVANEATPADAAREILDRAGWL